jgi:D-glycero-alpha-D-manno-heptose 1-phosphate guanylyltransferase
MTFTKINSNRINVNSAVILAGGLGTRLQNTVPGVPKPMAPINGRPFLEYQIDYWIAQGIEQFVISVGYLRQIIMSHFGKSYREARIDYAIEKTPQGTGGGLLRAIQKLKDQQKILLLNGDTFFEVNLSELDSFHTERQSDWTFSLFRSNEKGRYLGMEVDANGRVISLNSGSKDLGQPCNGGVYLVNTKILKAAGLRSGEKLSIEDDIMPSYFSAGKMLYGYICDGRFIDIGVPEDYFRSSKILAT